MSTLLANLLHDVPPLNMEGASKVKGAMYKQHKEEGMVRSAPDSPRRFYLTESVLKVVLQKSIPAQTGQHILI